jgi:hypothetical protein
MYWATFWATFSQTHLVTLVGKWSALKFGFTSNFVTKLGVDATSRVNFFSIFRDFRNKSVPQLFHKEKVFGFIRIRTDTIFWSHGAVQHGTT